LESGLRGFIDVLEMDVGVASIFSPS
jgi:hypothetical protein